MRGHDYMSEIAGELWVDNPDIPVTSAEQVKDYNQVDPTTNKPKTIEQLNTEFKTAIQALENATGNTTLVSRVNNLWNILGTEEDVDNIINKFNEVVAFLDGIEETDRLNSLLDAIRTLINAKASKSDLHVEQGYGANADKVTIILGEGIGKSATVLKEHQDISGKANTADLATVATSGNYNDLTNKPTIPSLNSYATKAWVGEQGFLTAHQDISGKVDKVTGKGLSTNDYTTEEKTKLGALPTNSDLQTALSGKQDTISDLSTIRSGATAGATAVQPADIAALDATESGTSTDGKVSVEVTETDGVVTGVEVTTNDIASASALSAEVARAQGVEANKANAADVYTKQEVNGLVSTPHQQYVTVATKADLDAITTGSADTIYRVSNYDGTQVDTTKYAEYAWNGTQYVLLSVKSAVGEVFDISEYNSGSIYNSLSEALGPNGDNVPVNNRKPGMSLKFKKRLNYDLYSVTVETDTNNAQLDGWNSATTIEHELVDGTDLVAEAIVANLDTTVTNDHSEKGDVLAAIQALNLNGTAKFAYTLINTVEGDGDIPLQRTYYYLYTVTKTTNEATEYVQYRLMSTAWSIATSDWQGVDDKPIAESDNLVKSGGIKSELDNIDLFSKEDVSTLRGQIIGITTNFDFETIKVTRIWNVPPSYYALILNADDNEFAFSVSSSSDYLSGVQEYTKTRQDGKKMDVVVKWDGRRNFYNSSIGIPINRAIVNIDLHQIINDNTTNINVLRQKGMVIAEDDDVLRGQLIGVFVNFNFTELRVTRFVNVTSAKYIKIKADGQDFDLLYNQTAGDRLTGIHIYEKEYPTTEDKIKIIVRFDGDSVNYFDDATGLLINKSIINNNDYLRALIGNNTTAIDKLRDSVNDAVHKIEQTTYNSESTGTGVSQYNGFCRVDYETPRIVASDGFHVIKFPVQKGDVITTNTSYGSTAWGHILYDSNNAYLATIRPDTNGTFNIDNENASYIAITWNLADVSLDNILATQKRFKPLIDIVENIDTRVTKLEELHIPVNNAYKGVAPTAFKNKLLSMNDDINILLVGDSQTAFTNVGPIFENAANLPAGCNRNSITFQLWDMLCKNKPQCDRFDSNINSFTENGTWNLSDVTKQNNSVISGAEKGEFSPDNCIYHESTNTGDSVSFVWQLDDYEKLNFIHRISAYDGTTEVTISCDSNKILVYDRANLSWVEANGFTFSQHKDAAAKSSRESDWVRNVPLKMKRVSGATGNITITLTNTGSGTMYYWGTERYNFNTVRVTNIGRGGKHIEHLLNNIGSEIDYRDVDLIIVQLPLWNEMKQGGDYNGMWDSRHIMFLNYLKSRSNDFADFQVIVNVYHQQVNDWIGNKNIQFQANGIPTNPKTNLPSWDCAMKTITALKNYDDNVPVCNLINEVFNYAQYLGITMEQILSSESQMSSSTFVDENAVGVYFTVDGCHCSNIGFKFYSMCIAPMMYD